MRKLLTGGFAVLAGVVSPMALSVSQSPATNQCDYRNDPRLRSLQKFFERADCPAADVSHVFLEAADTYDLDWRLLPSISFVESTGGKQARHNNIFGWDSGNASFPSVGAGILTVGRRLATSPLYRDKSLDEVLATYNPRVEYAQLVKSVMRRIGPE